MRGVGMPGSPGAIRETAAAGSFLTAAASRSASGPGKRGFPASRPAAREGTARSSPTSAGGACDGERFAPSTAGSGTPDDTRARFANNAAVNDQRHPGGLSSKDAAKRLRQLGPIEDRTSRSVASIVAGNVFTFFNLIIGVFFVVMLALGLFADALFGFIAVINSYIGIRQELKAKETLESLALLVAPKARVVRDGELVELRAEEI